MGNTMSNMPTQSQFEFLRSIDTPTVCNLLEIVAPERIKPLQEAFIQGWGGLPVVGTREQVVDTLATLSKAGLDGLLVAFPRYEEGLRDFRDKTYPLLQQAGLRDFV